MEDTVMQVIAHNLLSQFSSRQLNITDDNKSKSSEKLSSGYRINRAADDAAGLAISEKMRWQVRGLHRASLNISDGISLCQVADGALNESHEILQRMRELSIQAASDTNTNEDRQAIQWEIEALTEEVDRIADDTEFNKEIFPLKGISSSVTAGPGGTSGISTSLKDYASYIDSNGKLHYVLGSGTFQISDVEDCVLDVAGEVILANTHLTNVSIQCAAGTKLSVSNVIIDNSANREISGDGIGSAIVFTGAGNILNCYGNNEFNGGVDAYVSYTDGYLSNAPGHTYKVAASGINVGDGAELEINGTSTSNLTAHGCAVKWGPLVHWPSSFEASIPDSRAIGSNCNQDGGKIVINSGKINAYGYDGCIGGGKDVSVIINGGDINASGNYGILIGGGDTLGDGSVEGHIMAGESLGYAEVIINGGKVNAKGGSGSVIGFHSEGSVTINGGEINALASSGYGIGIGGYELVGKPGEININGGTITSTANGTTGTGIGFSGIRDDVPIQGTININGGNVTAISNAEQNADAIGWQIGRYTGTIDVFVEGNITDTSGVNDGNGHNIYTYNGSNVTTPTEPQCLMDNLNLDNLKSVSGTNVPGPGSGTNQENKKEKIWIQMGAQAGQGMYVSLVDATAKGVGITDPPLDVTSFENASDAIFRLEGAIDKVSTYRSAFGAQQNRLEHGKALDDLTAENSQAAESRIRDTDMAEEMVNQSKHSILQQAGQAMLAQANQSKNGILQLLDLQ